MFGALPSQNARKALWNQEAEKFHDFVMKGMFLVKQVLPGEEPGMGFLSSRVRDPTEQDNAKLMKIPGH